MGHEEVADAVEIEAPLVAAAVGENFEFMAQRMIAPDGGADADADADTDGDGGLSGQEFADMLKLEEARAADLIKRGLLTVQ